MNTYSARVDVNLFHSFLFDPSRSFSLNLPPLSEEFPSWYQVENCPLTKFPAIPQTEIWVRHRLLKYLNG